MVIKAVYYNAMSRADKLLLNNLLSEVWGGGEEMEDVHPREMNAMSFCAVAEDIFVGYAGVVSWDIRVHGETFRMCGLSCVCTHPRYRQKGIGKALVQQATGWMMQNPAFDIGLFTCCPLHTTFYEKVGMWEKASNLVLKESNRIGAHSSDLLGLDVFKLLLSEKAKLHAAYFDNSILLLNFPEGKFI